MENIVFLFKLKILYCKIWYFKIIDVNYKSNIFMILNELLIENIWVNIFCIYIIVLGIGIWNFKVFFILVYF